MKLVSSTKYTNLPFKSVLWHSKSFSSFFRIRIFTVVMAQVKCAEDPFKLWEETIEINKMSRRRASRGLSHYTSGTYKYSLFLRRNETIIIQTFHMGIARSETTWCKMRNGTTVKHDTPETFIEKIPTYPWQPNSMQNSWQMPLT